jgi:hypothetical protein
MEASSDRTYAYLQPGVWLSIYDLARVLHHTVRWVRTYVRDRGQVPHALVGDTEYFWTDDVVRWLEESKIDPRED